MTEPDTSLRRYTAQAALANMALISHYDRPNGRDILSFPGGRPKRPALFS